ncbi:MAG: hypothetical protein V2A67_01870 [Bacteroidota bacterium]
MKRLTTFLLFVFLGTGLFAQTPIPRKQFIDYARTSADWVWDHKDSLISVWRKGIDPQGIFGYRSPGHLLETSAIYATLYEMEGKKKYAERAKEILLTYSDYRSEFPVASARRKADYPDGVPALPDFFTTMRYIRAFDILHKKGLLQPDEVTKIENIIAHSMKFLLRTQEWGAMNRAALRLEALAWAVRAIPDHPVTKDMRTAEAAMLSDNWGQWEIEDASLYHAVWLYSLLGVADARNETDKLFKLPEMYYYANYFLNLMSPKEMIPDYGDAQNSTNWDRWMIFFEAAAKAYNSPEMKWAATVIENKFLNLTNPRSVGLGYMLLDIVRYGSESIVPKQPTGGSAEVMEDIVGKKIVFRNGWDPKSTYMLLNYRDEGDGGLLFRDYLRDAIPVEEEKMTHGHADENSISLLMEDGSLLLNDGAYRDFLPSGFYGSYRQDYFHNRLCVRPEKIWFGQKAGEYRYSMGDYPAVKSQPVLDFLHNAGSYRRVETQKIDFLAFPDVDYSRTRLIDETMGYEWDRVIAWVKDPGFYAVFDILKSRSEQYFTGVNLWHSRKIVSQGPNWYDTQYDSLQTKALNPDKNLLILFPKTHYRFYQTGKANRHFQQEYAITEYTGQYFELGQHIAFVTVLVPHDAKESPESWIKAIQYVGSEEEEEGVSVKFTMGDRTIRVGIKCDMKMDNVRDYERPKYTWESGKIKFEDVESNADFIYTDQRGNKLSYTVVNLTKASYKGQLLFEQPSSYFGLNFDGQQDASRTGKARLWRDTIEVK